METKILELRDHATFIPVVAMAIDGTDGPLARAAGYGHRCILYGRLNGGRFSYDPYDWNDRTYHVSHKWIEENWEKVSTGDVIDVRFILGETAAPAESDLSDLRSYMDAAALKIMERD